MYFVDFFRVGDGELPFTQACDEQIDDIPMTYRCIFTRYFFLPLHQPSAD